MPWFGIMSSTTERNEEISIENVKEVIKDMISDHEILVNLKKSS